MSTVRLQSGDQIIDLVQTLETTTKTLAELIYTPGLAAAVLRAQGIEATEILAVTPDLENSDVHISFFADNNRIQLSQTVQCDAFLVPFRLRRAIRSGSYKLAPIDPQQAHHLPAIAEWLPLAPGATLTAVYQHEHRPTQLIVCEPGTNGDNRCRCTCPDAQSQLATLPTHPALWEAMGQQTVCKHWLRHARQ